MDQYIGKMLDNRYEILELIGSGGMANVYKAKCHRLNRLVAIKILKSEFADNTEFRRRFRDESRAVAQLSHANIVSVYDVSTSGDTEYIVMELIDGITLKQYMERRGKMDWREALHFITQIMRALAHAHSRGIIHRDIKPQNIMVLRDGSVKVADFGIACLANEGQTLTQEALGSVHYISPEQARGDRIDARSDIYSAGVVLYEMLTGRLPFEGDSAVSVAIQHLSSVPLPPRDINPDIPEALELICMKAMSPNADKRYPTADAMLEDLEKFRKDPNVDLDYIRADLCEPADSEPTQHISAAEVSAVHHGQRPDNESVQKSEKKKMAIIIGAFAAALLIAFLIFQVIGSLNKEPTAETHTVPNVVGYTVEQAEALKEVKDVFTIEVIGTRSDSKYQPGQIVEQDPSEGRIRKNNFVIKVYICAEEEKFLVPDVKGQTAQEAKLALRNMNLGLQIETAEEFSDTVPAGSVISTSPASGSEIKKGNTVIVTVSKGPEKKPVTVPSFLTLSEDAAASKAQGLGLTVGEPKYVHDSAPEGQVIGQSIANGTTVSEGTEITFTISLGAETVSREVTFMVPDGLPADSNVEVKFYQDGKLVDTTLMDSNEDTVSYSFSGASGTTSRVTVYFGDRQGETKEITF